MSEIRVNRIDDSGQGFVEATTRIKTNLAPIEGTDLANKAYVDSRSGSSGVGADYVDSRDAYYYSQVQDNFVRKTGNISEDVNGIKTFEVPPRTNLTPSLGIELANKNYVDAQDESTLNRAKEYTDNRTGGSGAIPFSQVEFLDQIIVDASGETSSFSFLSEDVSGTLLVEGSNGISVYGVTGYFPSEIEGETGPYFAKMVISSDKESFYAYDTAGSGPTRSGTVLNHTNTLDGILVSNPAYRTSSGITGYHAPRAGTYRFDASCTMHFYDGSQGYMFFMKNGTKIGPYFSAKDHATDRDQIHGHILVNLAEGDKVTFGFSLPLSPNGSPTRIDEATFSGGLV